MRPPESLNVISLEVLCNFEDLSINFCVSEFENHMITCDITVTNNNCLGEITIFCYKLTYNLSNFKDCTTLYRIVGSSGLLASMQGIYRLETLIISN